MKRRRFILVLVLAVACGGVAAWLRERLAPIPVAAERPFTDLGTALADDGPHGWELHIPPRFPGPYRLLPGGTIASRDPKMRIISRVRDDSGAVLEELEMRGDPAFDQLVVYLETPEGRRTMAVLKRPR